MDTTLRFLALLGLMIVSVNISGGDNIMALGIYIAGVLSAIFLNMRVDYD